MRDDDNKTGKGQQVLQTKEVYVLMNDDYSISRNARSSWYLRNLNSVLPCKQKEHLSKSDDFEIISVIPTDDLATRERSTNCYFCLAPSTTITFLAHRYNIVFILDTSPSLASLDMTSSGVLYDRVFISLRNTLKSLVKPFCTPGSTLQLRPQIHVSIIVHTTVISCRMKQVLIHGLHVTQDNVDDVLSQVQKDLSQLESSLASSIAHVITDRDEDESDLQRTSESSQADFSIRMEYLEQTEDRCILPADISFVSMLRYGLLALQLLPENCTSGIVVITDGVLGFPDSAIFEALLQQMRHDMVACSFVQVGSGFEISRGYSHVPYPELMQFMATATFGTYFSTTPRLTETGDPAMNSVHRGILTRSFQRPLDSHTLRNIFSSTFENEFFHNAFSRDHSSELSCGHLWSMPFMLQKYSDSYIPASLTAIVACRLRDGFSIRNVTIGAKNPKGESQIEIQMVLPWRDRVTILYIARSVWPLTSFKHTTHVEVITEATQDFFQESTAVLSQMKSPYIRRMAKYWDSLKLMSQTDQKMVHFQSFNTNPANYTIPEPLRDGVPLFFYPGQISEPQVSRQLNQRDPNISDFVNFWKQALTMDVTMWHKWMHIHHIGLILEHDIPVGKHLHTPNSNGRYTSIFCRQAMEVIMEYLRRSTSFVLMEKHSYVRILFSQYETVPTSFYLIRVDSKSPYLILRVAFLGGMPGKQRTQLLSEIKSGVTALRFPSRGIQRQNGSKRAVAKFDPDSRQPALERHWTEIPCCVVTKKPLEKILIKYEKVPSDFSTMELIPSSNEKSMQALSASTSRVALHSQTTLSNYLSHHRWIWSLQHGSLQLLSVHTVGKILSTLTKIRLQEGFHFAACNSGILNMATEVDMQAIERTTSELCACVIQYIIFPLHSQLKNGASHEAILRTSVMSNCSEETLDDIEGIEPEGSGLEIVTECWVEPQHGQAVTDSPQLNHLNGLDYKQLLESVFPIDLDCISVIVTFEYLSLICQNSEVPIPPMTGGSSLTMTEISHKGGHCASPSLHLDHSIDHISFPFDLVTLIGKSQQVELLFSVYRYREVPERRAADMKTEVCESNGLLFNEFLEQIQTLHDRELPMSEDDSLLFVKSIVARQRDQTTHPLPFPLRKIYADESREPASANQPRSESRTNVDGLGLDVGHSNVVAARWRCFIRLEEDSHLILTLLPASSQDLMLLMTPDATKACSQEQESAVEDDDSKTKVENGSVTDSESKEKAVENDTSGTSVSGSKENRKDALPSVLPIYIYNCPYSVAYEQLVNRWKYIRPSDIFEDLTFEEDAHCSGFTPGKPGEGMDKVSTPRLMDRMSSFPGLDPRRSSEYEGSGTRDRWRRSADDIYKEQELLGQLRTHISEIYFRCFVAGVYESLRAGRWVDAWDVDAAINRVCEESGLFEINISKFLSSSCQTMKSLLEAWNQDNLPNLKEKTEDLSRKSGCLNPLIGLFDTHLCEPSSGLHELLRSKFRRILNPHFRSVPAGLDFFYYSGPAVHRRFGENTTLQDNSGILETDDGELGGTQKVDDLTPFLSEGDFNTDNKAAPNCTRVSSNFSSSDSVGDDMNRMNGATSSTTEPPPPPLFIHLMCSVHLPSGLQSTPVQSLPMCLSELGDCFSELALSDCDISELKVTLDFICLTLPPLEDVKTGGQKPSYNRTISTLSQTSVATDEETEGMPEVKPTSTPLDLHGVKHLPKCQQQSVKICKDEIVWMIEDEVISFLRLVIPVTEKTLCSVVTHIKSSNGRPICIHDDVLLQFIFGPDLSMKHFIEQFEKLRIQKYRLCKEGTFYYLCKDHICNNVIEGASALSSALKQLNLSSPMAVDTSVKADTDVNADSVAVSVLNSGNSDFSENPNKENDSEMNDKKDAECEENDKNSKDIQILVSRPSPIRETPVTKMEEEKAVDVADTGEKENENETPSVTEMSGNTKLEDDFDPESSYATNKDAAPEPDKLLNAEEASDVQEEVLEATEVGEEPVTDVQNLPEEERAVVENNESVTTTGAISGSVQQVDTSQTSSYASADSELVHAETRCRRVRPISGPANYVVIRENQSMADNFDGTRYPFHSFSQQNINRESPSSMKPLIEYSSMHCIKRVQSSLSFEKLRPERQKSRYPSQGNSSSECNTPQTDGRAALRSRHASGLETPISAVDSSSLASTGEAGYEGDSSDPDEDGAMMSYNESISTVQRRLPIPDFWLILRVNSDKAEVYFHTRDDYDIKSTKRYKDLFRIISENIRQLCHSVNQKLLLMDMYTRNYCDILLVPEADDDIKWSQDVVSQEKTQKWRYIKDFSSDSDYEESRDSRYLAANMQFGPGHFACECVYQTDFILHPRLKMAPQRGKESPGVQALMSVLEKFVVVNRKNMYVLKDSSNDNVFYVRLSESSQEIKNQPIHQPSLDSDDCRLPASHEPSSSSSMLIRSSKPDGEDSRSSSAAGMSDRDGDHQLSLSQSFRSSSFSKHRTEDKITLSVFGIGSVGPEISQDLIQVLQRKLDEAILDVVTLTLSRNAMCKLMAEDIQFIQKPFSEPVMKMQFVIPSSVILHQYALAFYLRQNLLQFLFTPKYADGGKSEYAFQNYENSTATPIPESDLFLYIRPQQSGGKGIACIQLSFVDARGSPIQLLGSPKMSSQAYKEPLDKSMFDGIVNTSIYKPSISPTKAPGPMSLIQFRIWECGSLDLSALTDLLLQATKHAICDIVTEYRLLTAPICEVPLHYEKGVDSPMHSAPASPGLNGANSESRYSQDTSVRRIGINLGRTMIKTPKEASSSIHTLFDMLSKSSAIEAFSSREEMRCISLAAAATEFLEDSNRGVMEHDNHGLMKKIQRYESGEKGNLTSAFVSCIPDWLDYCDKLGVPAVNKYEFRLPNRFPIDYFLKESSSIVGNITQDTTTAIFRSQESVILSEKSSDLSYVPYQPLRTPAKDGGHEKVTLDFVKSSLCGFPGRAYTYVVVGRNVAEWRNVIASLESEIGLSRSHTQQTKVFSKCQKFPPLECDAEGKPSSSGSVPSSSSTSLDQTDKVSVPRQRLFLMILSDKQLTVYLYNWAADLASSLERQLFRQIQWHAARSQVLNCIIFQKMGLFHRYLLVNVNLEHFSGESNPFLLTVADVDHLIKSTVVPQSHLQKIRTRSGSVASNRVLNQAPLMPLKPQLQFDELYRDHRPSVPMHKSSYGGLRDPLHRVGAQLLELRSLERKENEKRQKLNEIYLAWQPRLPATPTISDYVLDLLKKSSRMIHYVSTPLLFNPVWLQHQGFTKAETVTRRESLVEQKRSRHGSGTSVKSKRSDSIESTKKAMSCVSLETLTWQPNSCQWYMNLCQSFLTQYTKYLQSMAFCPINCVPYVPEDYAGESINSSASDSSLFQFGYTYLQKSSPGGIVLIELEFRDVYFCVTVYALECSCVPAGKEVSPQLTVIFTDECDKFKDLTHLHSFSHDFHVRLIQAFVAGDHSLIPSCYLTSLLREMMNYFTKEPSFSWNYIQKGAVSVSSGLSSGQQVFDYMLQNRNLHLTESVTMTAVIPENDPHHIKEGRSALVCSLPDELRQTSPSLPHNKSQRLDGASSTDDQFDVGLVVSFNPSSSESVGVFALNLHYWIVVTNRQQIFPKLSLEKKLALSTALQTKVVIPTPSFERHFVPKDLSAWNTKRLHLESINYRGYSNVHQMTAQAFTGEAASVVEAKILEMATKMQILCRRDFLWQSLHVAEPVEDDTRRRRKTGADDELREPHLSKMAFSDFNELLSLVSTVDATSYDPDLRQLLSLPMCTFSNLVKVLICKYPEASRYLSSQQLGGSTQYVVVFNPKCANAFALLTLNEKTENANLSAVYRESDKSLKAIPGFQKHLTDVINTCCYNLWTQLIP